VHADRSDRTLWGAYRRLELVNWDVESNPFWDINAYLYFCCVRVLGGERGGAVG